MFTYVLLIWLRSAYFLQDDGTMSNIMAYLGLRAVFISAESIRIYRFHVSAYTESTVEELEDRVGNYVPQVPVLHASSSRQLESQHSSLKESVMEHPKEERSTCGTFISAKERLLESAALSHGSKL